jgi:iron complex outermembrane recepter protein
MGIGGGRKRIGLVLLGAMVAAPAPGHAQSACTPEDVVMPAQWEGPLTRRVTLRAADITIGNALDRLAEAARIRFSYSADGVPLGRRVCVSYDAAPVGRVLAELLHGTGVEAVVAGPEHVVLAPVRALPQPQDAQATEAAPVVIPLDPVHVCARGSGAPRAAAAAGAVVIDGSQLAQRGSTSLAEIVNGAVPGMWIWHDGSGGTSAAYGSVRGASSFRATSPAVYIDGIEVANSQLLTRISPATVERIEIFRGPQGAALYGANALSGVINIITRRDHADGSSPVQYVQSSVGVTGSDFAGRPSLSQDHAVGIVTGADGRSAGLNVAVGTHGEYAPGAAAQHIATDAFGRITGSRSVVTATLRFLAERSGTASSPLLPDSLQRASPVFAPPNALVGDLPSMRQYTAGLAVSYQPNALWSHSVTAGVDGYRVADRSVALSGTDLLVGALRATLRASSARRFDAGDVATGTVTFTAEHSLLRQQGSVQTMTRVAEARRGERAGGEPRPQPVPPTAAVAVEQSSSTTGLSAQSDLLFLDRLLLTGGIRLERGGSLLYAGRWAALPTIAATLLASKGATDIRLRTAFSRAVRWPAAPVTSVWQSYHRSVLVVQPPEEQTGIEAGIDVRIGELAALHVTRFDQVATGAGQQTMPAPSHAVRSSIAPRAAYSVGTIANRGWELEASLAYGRLGLDGTLSFVDSRVRSLAAGDAGDLRPGDRMLAVPARTASLSASWTDRAWSANVTAARAADWINYDRLALFTDLADYRGQSLPDLRRYWRRYDGFTHLNATATHQLGQRFSLTLTGTNLLGVQVGEPDNITVLPGRSFGLGVRATF